MRQLIGAKLASWSRTLTRWSFRVRGIDPKASEVPVVKPKPKRELGPLGKATACSVGLMLSGLEMQSQDIADDAAEGYAQAADTYKQSRGGL